MSHTVHPFAFDALIWDMNGVLLDDEQHQWEAFKRVLKGRGLDVPDADFSKYCGVTEQECFAMALQSPFDSEGVRECMRERRACYIEILGGRLPLYPSVPDAVQRAEAAGIIQAIASGACREEVMAVVEALGPSRFRAVVVAEDVTRGKPNPEGYLKAAGQLGVDPSRCLVVEDSLHGIEAALAAGMQCLAVASTLPQERLGRAHAVASSVEAALQSGLFGF
jgi:beta-phosphoglucomutase